MSIDLFSHRKQTTHLFKGGGICLSGFLHRQGGDHRLSLPVQQHRHAAGIAVLMEEIIDAGLGIHPDFRGAEHPLTQGADKTLLHNLLLFTLFSGRLQTIFEKLPRRLWAAGDWGYSLVLSTMPLARPTRPCISLGMMILVAFPSATFCMASMAFSFSTLSLGAC